MCKANGRGRLQANFVVVSLSRSKRLTIPVIKTMITGVGDEISFLKVWDAECKKKSTGTEANYRAAKNSFVKYLGEIKGFRITAADIQKWCDSLVADGISKSTIGMYLRSFRVA